MKFTIEAGAPFDVEIDEDDLREADWIPEAEAGEHCELAHCQDHMPYLAEAEEIVEALRTWHNDAGHRYGFGFCEVSPCAEVQKVLG